MLKNYLKIALRNLLRHKLFSFLNITGLTLGIASCILILLWVKDEVSYDKFHTKSERIYRITETQKISTSSSQELATTSGPLANALKLEIPEVQEATRLLFHKKVLLGYKEQQFYEDRMTYADSNFFKVFDFKLVKGNPTTALSTPNSIVITHETALKYFGNEDPIGKALKLNNKADFLVTGVVENPPVQSHFHFTAIASISSLNNPKWMSKWGVRSIYTYVLLNAETSAPKVADKLPSIVEKYFGEEYLKKVSYSLQPIADIHLTSKLVSEIEPNGDRTSVYVFVIIALSILTLACFNYINLSTAQSLQRLKEVGLRKTLGALKGQLLIQFLGEAFVICLISILLSIILVELSLPTLNLFLGKNLSFLFSGNINLLLIPFGLLISITLVSGIFPAYKLSLYNPAEAVANRLKTEGVGFRKFLSVTQFAISITLIIITIVVYFQYDFIQNKGLGFNKELLINIKGVQLTPYRGNMEPLKQEFLKNPAVSNATASLYEVGQDLDVSEVRRENGAVDENIIFSVTSVDHSYLETLEIPLLAGRNFRPASSDTLNAFVINEEAVKRLGFKSAEEALGQKVLYLGNETVAPIVGVVKDFHFASLHQEIQPLLMMYTPSYLHRLTLKIHSTNIKNTITGLEANWKNILPGYPFDFEFADEGLNNLYSKDVKIKQLLTFFTCLAIFIACLGLFGLASFTARLREKEIGIRKVLGASIASLLYILSRDFLTLIFIALSIATPIGWWAMHSWLQNFAYRVEVEWWVFIMAGGMTILIALSTIGILVFKAAVVSPVRSLRGE